MCHPEFYWPWAYAELSPDLLDDIQEIYPDMFLILNRSQPNTKGMVSIQFRCQQLPADLIGRDVSFTLEQDLALRPIVNFKSVYGR